jgi:2,3-bisphosphoglycerate-independent phosphoglycerate mutase
MNSDGAARAARKYVLIIPDGAADESREDGKTPLAVARTPSADFVAREGVSGLVQTLYDELPKESMVALLGILGWEPHRYHPRGRASCELLALENVPLHEGDLAFRANLARMEHGVLVSYSANYITSEDARPLVKRLNSELRGAFPDLELYHNSDFRNTLVLRGAGVDPAVLFCPEPHESHGMPFSLDRLVSGGDAKSRAVASKINRYVVHAARLLARETANVLFPWSASRPLQLPPFREHSGFSGRTAAVGCMDFLHGIAKAGGIDFVLVGNGRPTTDFCAKGDAVIRLLIEGYEFVICHINAPDEAAHMQDFALKVRCLESIDESIVRPIVEYFQTHPGELGGVMVVPDHYTNCAPIFDQKMRRDVHAGVPVPFALWNGRDRDGVETFTEDAAAGGLYGNEHLGHMDLLGILTGAQRSPVRQQAESRR